MEQNFRGLSVFSRLKKKGVVVFVATATVLGSIAPAWATIDNTVTVRGTPPGGSQTDLDTATENVDVIDAIDQLTVTKTADTAGPVGVGDTITYTYTATNTGNTTLTAVSMSDPHDAGASGTLSTIAFVGSPLTDNGTASDSTDAGGDNIWDTLAPLDVVTWEATYVVTQDDITNQVGGDGNINNVATGNASDPDSNSVTDDSPSVDVPVEAVNASLAVAKVGQYGLGPTTVDGTTDNLPVGEVITYTYTITNDGNVPITAVSLVDVHNGSGADPAPDADAATLTDNGTGGDSTNSTTGDSVWDVLAPNDVLVVTATYTVTQDDVDNLQ